MLQLWNNKGREIYKKKCAAQLDFSRYRCRWELHYCILFFAGVTYKYIKESFAFSPRLISVLYRQMWVSGWDHVHTNPSLTPTGSISAYWFLALSHQKRLSPDIFLLPGFSRTCVLHTALASTALESRAKMHKCIRFKWRGIGVDEFSVWNSRKGYMEKELLMHPVNKSEDFQGPLLN